MTIGFVRIVLSSSAVNKEIKKTAIKNITISAFITIFVIGILHVLISNIVIDPIKRLNKAIVMFKEGILSEIAYTNQGDEISELFHEFQKMSLKVKEREKMLIESEKRIKSIFERVEHAIFRLNSDCVIIEANRQFNNMFGNVEKICDILISESDINSCIELASCEKSVNKEVKAVSKDGKEITVLISLYPEKDINGNILGFDGYIIDITEKKRLEESLFHARKMEAIGILAGGIAHDFNNLLQGILGYASLLKMNLSEKDKMYKPIDTIEKSAIRASNLTKQLLGFARKGKYIVEPMSLNSAVEDVFEVISRTFDKSIKIEKKLNNIWTVEADKNQIEHVILNLCINAKDAMPGGGILSMETFNFEGKPIPSANYGKYVVLKVSDTGIGMDKLTQSKIFEPFFTTKEKGKGTGMGLAMVYGVVKNHGGFINVYSEVGKGSTFTVYLPAIEKIGVAEEIQKKETITIDGKGTILIVDDEEIVRDTGRAVLERLGYNVLEASDGLEALKIYKDRQDDIFLIILDVIMPNMNGKETFIKLKEINPNANVLVSSGYSINGAAKEIIDLGAKGFIQKPYNMAELAKAIQELSI